MNYQLGSIGQRVLGFGYTYLPAKDFPHSYHFITEAGKENFPL